jgi:DNA-binding HxlR family transcriptional regulator
MPPTCSVVECADEDCLQLTVREEQVCEAVCSSEAPVRFSELARAVGFHQEIVSRILRRLVNHGCLEKVAGGYQVRSVNN